MTRSLSVALVTLIVVTLLYGATLIGVGGNLGLPFGYYGKLNRVRAEIQSIPGLSILRESLQRDLTLEDFHLLVTNGSKTVWLSFNTEQGRKTWERFHQPGTALHVRWQGGASTRSFSLGSESDLSSACGRSIENLADVLSALDAILTHVGDPELLRQADASQKEVRVRLDIDG